MPSAARPWLPAPPRTVPAAGHSRGGRTAGRAPGRSWPENYRGDRVQKYLAMFQVKAFSFKTAFPKLNHFHAAFTDVAVTAYHLFYLLNLKKKLTPLLYLNIFILKLNYYPTVNRTP